MLLSQAMNDSADKILINLQSEDITYSILETTENIPVRQIFLRQDLKNVSIARRNTVRIAEIQSGQLELISRQANGTYTDEEIEIINKDLELDYELMIKIKQQDFEWLFECESTMPVTIAITPTYTTHGWIGIVRVIDEAGITSIDTHSLSIILKETFAKKIYRKVFNHTETAFAFPSSNLRKFTLPSNLD